MIVTEIGRLDHGEALKDRARQELLANARHLLGHCRADVVFVFVVRMFFKCYVAFLVCAS